MMSLLFPTARTCLAGAFLATGLVLMRAPSLVAAPLEIAAVKHDGPVDFEKEILPVFRRNCLACHSATEAQSDLVLESPQTILKGGSEGPAVVAGKSGDSLLLKLASHQKEPYMPPPDNDVRAKPLTPQELGLLKLWIDEGAKGEVKGASTAIVWQPLPPGINPIYAVAITQDGQYAAASRANQIFLYHLPSKRELGRLTDPALLSGGVYKQPGVADLDLVQTLRFSPDGTRLASGGFRTVKLWHRPAAGKARDLASLDSPGRTLVRSSDGKQAAIGQENGQVKIIDLASGKAIKTLSGHGGPVTGAAFTAAGARLVTGSLDKTVRVWDVAGEKQLASIETPAPVHAVAALPGEKQLAAAGEDKTLRIYELPEKQPEDTKSEEAKPDDKKPDDKKPDEAAKPVKELAGHDKPVTALALAGQQLVSGSEDGTLRLWDVAAGKAAKTLNHGAPVTAIAASPDGTRLVSVSSAGNAKLWNVEKGEQIAELKGNLDQTLEVAELTRAAALAKKQIDLAKKDLDDANKRKTAEEENEKKSKEAVTKAETDLKPKVEAAKKATDEKTALDKAVADATAAKTKSEEAKKSADELLAKADEAAKAVKASQEAAAKIESDAAAATKAAAEKAVAELTALRKLLEPGQQAADKAVKDAAAALAAAEKKVKDQMAAYQKAVDEKTAADRTLETAKRGIERAAEAVKKAVAAIPGVEAIVKQREADAKERDAALAKATAAAKESDKPLKSAAFSPDGKIVATVGDDKLVHTWDAASGAAIEVESGASSPLTAIAFLPGGDALVAAADKSLALYRFPTEWKHERTIGTPETGGPFVDRVTALDFSPDGKTLAVGSGEPSRSGEIKLFDVASGEQKLALKEPHSDTVNCLAFSPDGQTLASCGADRFVKLWNVADGKFIRALEGHTHHVLGVSWRADGRMLVSSGADMVLKVWDTRTGDQLRTVQNQFTKEVTSVSFVADGDMVVASGGDSKVRFISAANGNNQRDFGGTAEYMYSVAASADGKTIVAGGLDSVLRVWNDQGQDQAKFAPPAEPKDQTAAK